MITPNLYKDNSMSRKKTSNKQQKMDHPLIQKFQNTIKQDPTRTDKLVFYQSDDDGQNQSSEEIDLPLPRSTMLNLRINHHHQFGFSKDSAILKPSIIRFQQDDSEYIKQDINNLHRKTIKKETDEQAQRKVMDKMMNIENRQKKKKDIQFFHQETSLLFQNLESGVSESIQISKSNRLPISLLYQESQQSQNKQFQQELCIVQSQQTKKQQKENGEQVGKEKLLQQDSMNYSIKKQVSLNYADNLLDPNQQIIASSLQFHKFFIKSQSTQSIRQHLINPIKDGTRHIFHLYINQNFLAKSFQLWLDCQPQNILLLQANKTIKLQRSQYEISAFMEDINQYMPLCSLISNIDRNEYNLQIDNGSYIEMAATISAHLNFHGNRSFVIYVPTIDEKNGKSQVIKKNEQFSSLRIAYRQKQNPNVTFSSSEKFAQSQQKIFKILSLRQSKKNALYRNKKDHISLIFGRKGQNEYSIISGGGYSPIQILSLAITNIQAL